MNENTLAFLQQDALPTLHPQVLARYELLFCLSDKGYVQTYQMEDRVTGAPCVMKVYDKQVFPGQEAAILHAIHHPGVPQTLAIFDDEQYSYVVRSYVEGQTVEALYHSGQITVERAIDIMINLADIVSFLHSQSIPVIHRDIKPSNVILTPGGRVVLIDFEIARQVSEGQGSDTVVACTRDYAAPEQYGYSQTDQRSDIYAMGVMLLYMVTGTTELQESDARRLPPSLVRIIRRCTAFSPTKRYQHVEAMQKDLRRAAKWMHRPIKLYVLSAALIIAALFLGGYLGIQLAPQATGISSGAAGEGVTFAEPLIGQAVRLSLGKGADDPVTEADLLSVEQLFIFGNRVARTTAEYWNMQAVQDQYLIGNGSILSLEDLRNMPNLKQLYLSRQPITDISPLADLHNLQILDLRDNTFLVDLSALADMRQLRDLGASNTTVEDVTPLRKVPLTNLDLTGSKVYSIEPLRSHSTLKYIALGWGNIQDYTPLLSMPALVEANLPDLTAAQQASLADAHFQIVNGTE